MAVESAPTGASAVAVMVDVEAGAAMSAVIVQRAARKVVPSNAMNSELMAARKAVQMAGEMSDANAAPTSEVLSHEVSSAMSNAANYAENHEAKAKSSASHAHSVNHVNPAKAAARSARAVNAVNAVNVASNARPWMPRSRTLPWPTRPQWQRLWAALRQMQARKPRAVSARNVATGAVATSAVMNHRANRAGNPEQNVRTSVTRCQQRQLRG